MHFCAQMHNNALATADQRKFTRYQKFRHSQIHFSSINCWSEAHFSKIEFLEMARLGYFFWTTGSLKASTICSFVAKVTNCPALPCTSPWRWRKSAPCGQKLMDEKKCKIIPAAWSQRTEHSGRHSSQSWREIAHLFQSLGYMCLY